MRFACFLHFQKVNINIVYASSWSYIPTSCLRKSGRCAPLSRHQQSHCTALPISPGLCAELNVPCTHFLELAANLKVKLRCFQSMYRTWKIVHWCMFGQGMCRPVFLVQVPPKCKQGSSPASTLKLVFNQMAKISKKELQLSRTLRFSEFPWNSIVISGREWEDKTLSPWGRDPAGLLVPLDLLDLALPPLAGLASFRGKSSSPSGSWRRS